MDRREMLAAAAAGSVELTGKIANAKPGDRPPVFWAIVELMGHVKLAGRLSEHQLGGQTLLRLDMPTENGQHIVQFISPSSLYRITPTTEKAARQVGMQRLDPIAPSTWQRKLSYEDEYETNEEPMDDIDPLTVLLDACRDLQTIDCFACMSGDCPHDTVHECCASLSAELDQAASLARSAVKTAEKLIAEYHGPTNSQRIHNRPVSAQVITYRDTFNKEHQMTDMAVGPVAQKRPITEEITRLQRLAEETEETVRDLEEYLGPIIFQAEPTVTGGNSSEVAPDNASAITLSMRSSVYRIESCVRRIRAILETAEL